MAAYLADVLTALAAAVVFGNCQSGSRGHHGGCCNICCVLFGVAGAVVVVAVTVRAIELATVVHI